jgi:hypothetical protein
VVNTTFNVEVNYQCFPSNRGFSEDRAKLAMARSISRSATPSGPKAGTKRIAELHTAVQRGHWGFILRGFLGGHLDMGMDAPILQI